MVEITPFVTVTTSHLVARLNATFDRQIDFDHLEHTRRQIVTCSDLDALLFVALAGTLLAGRQKFGGFFKLLVRFFITQANFKPFLTIQLIEILPG